ncbi:MAG: phosphatase PAP2 family protein [Polyangiaceae bacterium]
MGCCSQRLLVGGILAGVGAICVPGAASAQSTVVAPAGQSGPAAPTGQSAGSGESASGVGEEKKESLPRATSRQMRGPMEVRWAVDVPVTIGSFAIGAVPYLFAKELGGAHCGLACDKGSVNGLDRSVIGNRSEEAADVSDGLLLASVLYPLVFDLVDVTATTERTCDDYAGFGRDAFVLGEVLSINLALNTVVKLAVGRPRPYVYDPEVPEEERLSADGGLSFYSGHSSTAFSMATAYSYLFMLRHPKSPMVAPVWALAEGAAAVTAGLRVVAGQHFWTDVITGGVVGVGIGALVPFLHRRLELPVPAVGGGKVRAMVLPAAHPGGGGVMVAGEL